MDNEEKKMPDEPAKEPKPEASGQNRGPSLDKDTIYGGAVIVLVALLTISVLTSGFGVVPCQAEGEECPICPKPENVTVDPYEGIPAIEVSNGDLPHLGEADAPVTLVEVSDYQCPYCARFYTNTEEPLKENEIASGEAKLYFRDYPLSFHNHAMNAAIAARCANEQGRFWEMHSKLFGNQAEWSGASDVTDIFAGYASDIGLDAGEYEACYASRESMAAINEDMNAASESGVRGTPGTFIILPKDKADMEEVQAAYDALHAQYDQPGQPAGIDMYQDDENIIILVGGAYPYDVFSTMIATVE